MKKISLLFLFLISLNLQAQDILGEWYLHYIIDDENNTIPFNNAPYANLVFDTTTEPNLFLFYGFSGVSNDFNGLTSSLEPSSFDADGVGWTLVICDNPSLCYLEETYQLFWGYNYSGSQLFNYTITGSNSEETLTIYNTISSYTAVYGRMMLNLEENSLKNPIKLVENPVKHTLLFYPQGITSIITYKVFSLDGKVILEGDFENEIPVDTLNKGLYLIELTSRFGSKQLMRFVKK